MIGKTLAHYEVLSKIGAGGMGEVYRARDTSLDREVALKFLSPGMIEDIDHLARFEREAKLLASLNHPGIAVVYGLHEEDGERFLAMELVPGHDLQTALAAGPMSTADAIPIAVQIAHALAAAHDRGVVHRDLKPSNIMITPEGKAKVLDFGLAKSVEASGDSAVLSNSPTMTSPGTMAGVVLGTAAYMAPEQARGKPVDRRADLWAFGCVLYQMLTGRTAFRGETVTDLIASIIHKEPDWEALPAGLPIGVRRVLERCLRKDLDLRLRDAGDAALLLEEALVEDHAAAPESARPASRRRTFWVVASVAILAAFVGSLATGRLAPGLFSAAAPELASIRFTVETPSHIRSSMQFLQLSPDGKSLMITGRDDQGQRRMWVRDLDALEFRPVPASLGRTDTVLGWSPDSRHIVIHSAGKLRRVPVEGGELQPLCDMFDNRGASWGKDYIVFAESGGPIFRVPTTGGEPEVVTRVNSDAGETEHRYPHFLPDGETFTYVALPGKRRSLSVYAGHVDGRDPVLVTSAFTAPIYAHPGYLVFQRGRSIVAQRFDVESLTTSGEPVSIGLADAFGGTVGFPIASASRNGHLTYLTRSDPNTRLTWTDEVGNELGDLEVPAGTYESADISPDGRHVALLIEESPEESDIWILELERMLLTRFTHGPGPHGDPLWSPDGKSIAYSTNRDGPWDIYKKPFPQGGDPVPVVVGPETFKNPLDWSPDGKYILYDALGEGTSMDIWIASADGSEAPRAYRDGNTNQREAQFSPNGRWVAYTSRETGSPEVYVTSFPDADRKHRVSINGGLTPFWSADGSQIMYATPSQERLAVSFQAEPQVRTGTPRKLTNLIPNVREISQAPGGRFLLIRPVNEDQEVSATVHLNWMEGLETQ